MSTPKPSSQPTPDSEQTSPDADEDTSSPERDGFFRRVRQNQKPEKPHPSEAEEIVVEEGE